MIGSNEDIGTCIEPSSAKTLARTREDLWSMISAQFGHRSSAFRREANPIESRNQKRIKRWGKEEETWDNIKEERRKAQHPAFCPTYSFLWNFCHCPLGPFFQ